MAEAVKIFMCTHKGVSYLPPLCVAVQGGAKLNPAIENTVSDCGEGENISEKNPQYCELTVQYYAWKNEELDYYGFCHYRRFFCFGKGVKKPYITLGKIKEKHKKLLGDETEILKLIKKHDIISPKGEDVGCTVYEKYVNSPVSFKEDIDLFVKILNEKYPFLTPYAWKYLNGRTQYFCNMFIMKRELFFEYSQALFSILEEFDKGKRIYSDFQKDRVDGYLGERFFGIYLTYLLDKGKSVCFVPRIDTECTLKKRITNKILPPGSKIRLLVKRIKRG